VFEGHLRSLHVGGNPFRHKLFGDCTQERIALEASAENLDALSKTKPLYDLAHLLMVVIALDVEALRRSSTAHQAAIPRQQDSPSTLCTLQELCIDGVRIIHHINPHHTQPFRELPKHRIGDELCLISHDNLGL